MRILKYLFIAVVVVMILGQFVPHQDRPAPSTPVVEKKTDPLLDRAFTIATAIISNARDPQSITFDEMVVSENVTCVIFKGRNGFNGLTTTHIIVKGTKFINEDDADFHWNSVCLNKELKNYTDTVNSASQKVLATMK